MELSTYQPKAGADLVLMFKEDGENVCYPVARRLYDAYVAECHATGKRAEIYMPNLVYDFEEGIAFRLWDDDVSPSVLEFLAVPAAGRTKAEAMARLPDLLRNAGVEERLAVQLGGVIAGLVFG